MPKEDKPNPLEEGMDYVDQEEDEDEGPEIEMNWNLATYLPEGGAIQKNFNTVIAGYITANHQFLEEEAVRIAPGHTPIRRRRSSQSQTPNRRLSQVTGQPLTAAEYAQVIESVYCELSADFVVRKCARFTLLHCSRLLG